MKHTINLSPDLSKSLRSILKERGITLDEVVSLYLRAMVNNCEQGKALSLESTMLFGKYRGELVKTIVAADPGYMRFLIGSERPLQCEPEVLEKLK